MRALFVMTLLAVLVLPTGASAQVETITATHTYILGDRDSKEDARQRCLLEAKRKVLEQAGVYIESASEVKDLQLTKDKITSFAAAVMQVKDSKEEVGFQQGHMTLMLTITAQVDLTEVRKQLDARQVDPGMREDVATQKDRLKRLETQFEAMQKHQQFGQSSGRASVSPPSDISTPDDQPMRRLAAEGDRSAQFILGMMYLGMMNFSGTTSSGVPQDDVQAAKWLAKAAAQGSAMAQFTLGRLYSWGRGVSQDDVQASKWFEKAAAQGNALAQVFLGWQYLYARGVPLDFVQAARWFEKGAAQGNADAQFALGRLYSPQDYVQARQWYEKAAAQGNADAQVGLGQLYRDGHGVPQDYVQARQWFEKAAAQGYATAQANLGSLYLNGLGVQDHVLSYMWYSLAVQSNPILFQESLNKDLEKLQGMMTPAQLQEAQQLARNWTPKKQNTP